MAKRLFMLVDQLSDAFNEASIRGYLGGLIPSTRRYHTPTPTPELRHVLDKLSLPDTKLAVDKDDCPVADSRLAQMT